MAEIKYVSLSNLDYYDGKIKEHIADADATLKANLEGQVEVVANALDGEITRAKAAEATNAAAAQAAQEAADKAQDEVDALETYVGTIPAGATATNIVDYVQEKTSGIATDAALGELQSAVDEVEADVETIKGDYLKGTDKTELQGNIDAVADDVAEIAGDYLKTADKTELEGKINAKADQTALDAVSAVANAAATQTALTEEVNRAKGEEGRIEGLVTAEAERAAGVESGLEDRIETMEVFWAAAQADGTDSNVIDTLKEIQDYITNDETGAANMLASIEANEEALSDEVTRATEAEEALGVRIDTLDADYSAHTHSWSDLTDKPFGEGYSDTPILNETIETNNAENGYYVSDLNSNLFIRTESTAMVIFDDVTYYIENGIDGNNGWGNEHMQFPDLYVDNGLPFFVDYIGQGNCKLYATTSGSHTIQVYESGSVKTLDDKYIPDTIARVTVVDAELAKKVDKVDGYGLSKNDLSDALKANYDAAYTHSQEAHAPVNAQENKIESVKVNGTALTITDKAVDITIPTDNAELTNGAGYLVESDIANKVDKATTLAGYGIADAYTSAQTDTAIENAIGQFEECTTAEIEALFA